MTINMSIPWIKICGFTQVDNAVACTRYEPDAIGLVFFEKSPTNVTMERAAQICRALPEQTEKIGVFVDKPYDQVVEIVNQSGLTGVQLHGQESPEMVKRLRQQGLTVIKALFAAKSPDLSQASQYNQASSLLVEYGKGNLPGGNAESWDYRISESLNTTLPVVLAGGLSPENVAGVVAAVNPGGVDISSNVESEPGVKDPEKVKRFILAIRNLAE